MPNVGVLPVLHLQTQLLALVILHEVILPVALLAVAMQRTGRGSLDETQKAVLDLALATLPLRHKLVESGDGDIGAMRQFEDLELAVAEDSVVHGAKVSAQTASASAVS